VAVKLVYTTLDPRREAATQKAFLKEARISAAIAHRNVVQILDFGLHEGQVPFMVMELLEGESLGHVLRRGDAISMELIMEVVPQVLAGLAVAHDARVIHRDLKPDNIFLARTREGLCPKILDFGVSKILRRDAEGAFGGTTSSAGQILGTPAYMSPEQARGRGRLDERTDVYSMGVVLYELFSGLLPFYADSAYELLTKIIHEEEKPLGHISGEVSPEIEACVKKAMRKRPRERYPHAAALRADLLSAAPSMSGHRLPQRSARVRGTEVPVTPDEPPTMMMTPRAHAATVAGAAQPLASPADSGAASGVSGRALPARRRRLALLVAALSALAGFGALMLLLSRTQETGPRFIVVSGASPGSTESPAVDPSTPRSAASAAAATARSGGPPLYPAQLLTRSLRAQKGGLERCMRVHRGLALRKPKLSLKFDVAADGQVLAVTPSPSEIREGPLGTCLSEAAKAVRFDPPGVALSLDVPLTTRLGETSSELAPGPRGAR
jgi:serine/threonine-protein kinase